MEEETRAALCCFSNCSGCLTLPRQTILATQDVLKSGSDLLHLTARPHSLHQRTQGGLCCPKAQPSFRATITLWKSNPLVLCFSPSEFFFFLIELIFKPQNRGCSAKRENKTKYETLERYEKICNIHLETKI